MITVWGQRKEASGNYPPYENCPPRRVVSVGSALATLTKFELGYGGTATGCTETDEGVRLEITTRCLSKVDTVWFEGTQEEMGPLLMVTAACGRLHSEYKDQIISQTAGVLTEVAGGNAFLITSMAPLLMGEMTVKVALLSVMGVAEEDLETYKTYDISDLCAAWELTGYTVEGMRPILSS